MADHVPNSDGIISGKDEILKALIACQQNDTFLGVWSPKLGTGVFICKVETIHNGTAENDKVVILREKNLDGDNIHTHVLYLKEIRKVHYFKKM